MQIHFSSIDSLFRNELISAPESIKWIYNLNKQFHGTNCEHKDLSLYFDAKSTVNLSSNIWHVIITMRFIADRFIYNLFSLNAIEWLLNTCLEWCSIFMLAIKFRWKKEDIIQITMRIHVYEMIELSLIKTLEFVNVSSYLRERNLLEFLFSSRLNGPE